MSAVLSRSTGALTRIRGWILRGGWVMLDQALSSLSNGLVAVFAGRTLGPEGLGEVVRILAVAYLVLAFARAVSGEALLVYGARDAGGALSLALGVAGSVAVPSFILGMLSGVAGWTALGSVLGLVILQDWCRYVFFALRLPALACLVDAIWLAVQLALFGLLVASRAVTPGWVVLAWGLGAGAGALVGAMRLRPLSLRGAGRWFRATRSLTIGSTAQVGLSQGAAQIGILGIGAVAGSAALGGIRAGQVLVAPVAALLSALFPLLLPGLRSDNGPQLRRIDRRVLVTAAIGSGLAACYGAVLLLWGGALPFLFGVDFARYENVLGCFAVAIVFQGLAVGPGLGVRALGAGSALFATQAVAVVVGLPTTVLLAAQSGARGAALGIAIQAGALCAASWVSYAMSRRKAEAIS